MPNIVPVFATHHKIPARCSKRVAHERFRDFLASHDLRLTETDYDVVVIKSVRHFEKRNPNGVQDNYPTEFIHWLCVNYLRHKCCDYDRVIRVFSPALRSEMHVMLKHHVLDLIARDFPVLKPTTDIQRDQLLNTSK